MPHHRPRVATEPRPSAILATAMLMVMLALGWLAVHSGAITTLNAAKLFGR